MVASDQLDFRFFFFSSHILKPLYLSFSFLILYVALHHILKVRCLFSAEHHELRVRNVSRCKILFYYATVMVHLLRMCISFLFSAHQNVDVNQQNGLFLETEAVLIDFTLLDLVAFVFKYIFWFLLVESRLLLNCKASNHCSYRRDRLLFVIF